MVLEVMSFHTVVSCSHVHNFATIKDSSCTLGAFLTYRAHPLVMNIVEEIQHVYLQDITDIQDCE